MDNTTQAEKAKVAAVMGLTTAEFEALTAEQMAERMDKMTQAEKAEVAAVMGLTTAALDAVMAVQSAGKATAKKPDPLTAEKAKEKEAEAKDAAAKKAGGA